MNFRLCSIDIATTFAAVFVAGLSFAQQPQSTVAKLQDMQGDVLVSQGDAMVAATNDQRLAAGTRVVTTGGAKVTINYDVGCDVRLNENQRFTVRVGPCAALVAEVQSLGPAAGAIGGGTAGASAGAATGGTVTALGTTGIVLGTAAAVGLGFGAYEAFKKNSVSPN